MSDYDDERLWFERENERAYLEAEHARDQAEEEAQYQAYQRHLIIEAMKLITDVSKELIKYELD